MELFGIGEIARRAGVAPSTIRYYESIGLLPRSQRVNTKRRYDGEILKQLNVIRLAQQAGLTIAEIQSLLHAYAAGTPPSQSWHATAARKLAELDALMVRMRETRALLEQMLRCQCPTLEQCASLNADVQTGDLTVIARCGDPAAK